MPGYRSSAAAACLLLLLVSAAVSAWAAAAAHHPPAPAAPVHIAKRSLLLSPRLLELRQLYQDMVRSDRVGAGGGSMYNLLKKADLPMDGDDRKFNTQGWKRKRRDTGAADEPWDDDYQNMMYMFLVGKINGGQPKRDARTFQTNGW